MKSKKILKLISSVVIPIGILLVVLLPVYFVYKSKLKNAEASILPITPTLSEQINASSSFPVLLKIPRIKVNSSIEQVGITSDGEMDIPKDITNVAWFSPGVHPGEIGSAVIDGHYGWKNFKVAAFDSLSNLQIGDKLSVTDNKGVLVYFVVREMKTYTNKDDTKAIFISTDGKSHLNLITCGGVWNKAEKSYSERLVVFTDKVDSTSSPQ